MKRAIYLLMGILISLLSWTQQPQNNLITAMKTPELDKHQVTRIADFGRVWGVINYFHPASGKGILNTDSLVINHIGSLLLCPDAINFRQALQNMFATLGDTQSGIIDTTVSSIPIYQQHETCIPYKAALPSGEIYLKVPQKVFQSSIRLDSVLKENLANYQTFIIDLRNTIINNELGMRQYTEFVQPMVASLITTTLILPVARAFYYHGLLREDFPHDLNILPQDQEGRITDKLQVYYGIRNISEGAYVQANYQAAYIQKRFCFIINKYVNINTFKALLALRHRNLCNLIIEGPMPDYIYGEFYKMKLADEITVKIKTSEVLYEDGTSGSGPDLILPLQQDSSLLHTFILKQAVNLLHHPIIKQVKKVPENTVYIRRSQNDYPADEVPDIRLRLLGLFNFWNAVYYFSPNKNLIRQNWNDALADNIPEFYKAQSPQAYFFALLKLTAFIKDGHSVLISKHGGRSPSGVMDGNLPIGVDLVGEQVYITSVLGDTTQRQALSVIHEGDELLAIDEVPVNQLSRHWEPYIAASNKAGFNRDYYFTWLTNGITGSTAALTIRHQGDIKKIPLKRIKRDDYYVLRGKANQLPVVPPYCKIITEGIGYLRINRVYTNELDSLSNLLKNCKIIILDARGYPRDSQIGANIASYIADKTDTVAYNRFPFVVSPDFSKNYTIVEQEIIRPNGNINLKHKEYYLLADEGNQSQSEGNIITIQGVTHATVIGSQTAGANGMAITINFPGQYFSFFSGFGEYYPDGTPNQQLGVKIDTPVEKTLEGLLYGKDEILIKAIELAKQHKKLINK